MEVRCQTSLRSFQGPAFPMCPESSSFCWEQVLSIFEKSDHFIWVPLWSSQVFQKTWLVKYLFFWNTSLKITCIYWGIKHAGHPLGFADQDTPLLRGPMPICAWNSGHQYSEYREPSSCPAPSLSRVGLSRVKTFAAPGADGKDRSWAGNPPSALTSLKC